MNSKLLFALSVSTADAQLGVGTFWNPPSTAYDLNIMKLGQELYDVTARVLAGMCYVLKEAQTDVVLVHGSIVGYVEVGFRTNNIYA